MEAIDEINAVKQQIAELNTYEDMINSRLEISRQMPGWVRAASGLQMDSPEGVVYATALKLKEVPDDDRGIKAFLMDVAIHRIHRFGAGPDIEPESLEEIKDRLLFWADHFQPKGVSFDAERMKENLSEIWQTTPLEPIYAKTEAEKLVYMEKGPWPIILKPAT